MVPEAIGSTMDASPKIVPLLLVGGAHSQMLDSTLQLPTDATPYRETVANWIIYVAEDYFFYLECTQKTLDPEERKAFLFHRSETGAGASAVMYRTN